MQIFFRTTLVIVVMITIFFIYQTINFKNSEWMNNSPKIIEISSTTFQASFCVTKPASIYWRLYHTEASQPSPYDFTNAKTLSNTIAYGGGFSQNSKRIYTNMISNLAPSTSYNLYAIVVSHIGTFPKKVKKISFSTDSSSDNSKKEIDEIIY